MTDPVTAGARDNKEVTYLAPINQGLKDKDHVGAVLARWLPSHINAAEDLRIVDLQRPAGSGVANETLLVEAVSGNTPSRQWSLVIRIESPDYWYPERELEVHYRIYQVLQTSALPVPRVYAFESDAGLLGGKFFVMQRLQGRAPPDVPVYNLGGWLAESPPESQREVWREGVRTMARLHRISGELGASTFDFLARPERGNTGLEQSLAYWRNYYDWAAAGTNHPVMEAAWSWLRANIPASASTQLAWGDARYGNLLFADNHCTGLLDWDLVSLAGAESDLCWWLLNDTLNAKPYGVARLPGLGTPRETLDLWQETSGYIGKDLSYHMAFAAFRMGAVLMKLADFLKARNLLTPERSRMATDNYGTQILATMLGLSLASTPIVEWADVQPPD